MGGGLVAGYTYWFVLHSTTLSYANTLANQIESCNRYTLHLPKTEKRDQW